VDVRSLAEGIASLWPHYEGVTISGGEPFEQYEALMIFCAYLKSLAPMNVFVFSGYTARELEAQHPDGVFLRYVDYLLDGRYLAKAADSSGWRGSTNQRLFEIVEGRLVERATGFESRLWSLAVTNGRAFMSGVPRNGDLDRIAKDLEAAGLPVRFR
jgi:anaerobic ribonucleoside-triphosphate reductase activating protein